MRLLDTPINFGSLQLHNRLVMPPMATSKCGEDGAVTDALCAYYEEKSRGGALGLIVTEHAYIAPEGRAGKGQMSVSRDDDIAGLSRLVETVHRNGTKVIAQINHAGGAAQPAAADAVLLSPSGITPLRAPAGVRPAQEMTAEEIGRVTESFAAAARRAKQAGYDGVEIHSAHGYLLNQFYSPLTNRRTDAYTGATLAGRIRFHLEVIDAVRQTVGADYPVALRLGACDYMPGGSTAADSVQAAKQFVAAGIDLLDISGGMCGYVHPTNKAQGYFSELTEAIKAVVSVPVLLTGGITEVQEAEALLAQGKADLIGVGRALLRDSDWAVRAAEGR